MAPSILSFLFILVIFFSSHPHNIEARESKFFSKVTRYNTPAGAAKEPSSSEYFPEAPVYAPVPAPALGPGPASELEFQPDTQDGYGLYGRGSNAATNTVGENEVVPEEELTDESYQELAETSYSDNNNNKNNNNNHNGYSEYYNNNNNNNGYMNEKQQGMSDTRFLQNGKYYYNVHGDPTNSNKVNNGYYSSSSSNNNNNGYYSSSSNNNNDYSERYSNNNGYYSEEKQGMSDTRFLENGKYFYDVNNGYNTGKGSSSSTSTSTSTSNEANYYSNTGNSNEYNSMEEYQQGSDQEYVP